MVPLASVGAPLPGRLRKLRFAQSKVDGDACGLCNSCRLMQAGNHPDYTELDPDRREQELKVEPIREQIVDHVFQSPLQGNGLAFVIPDAQRLNPSAANALLKVMEEPPPGVHFILTASNSQSLLPTIRSRAPMLRLRKLLPAELVRVLVGQGMPLPQAERLALNANGSHRGLQDASEALPIEPLRQLLEQGYEPYVIGDLFDRMAEDIPAKEVNAAQRRVLLATIDRLIIELRQQLRDGHQQQLVLERIERLNAAASDIRRYIPQRLVIEHLAASTSLVAR